MLLHRYEAWMARGATLGRIGQSSDTVDSLDKAIMINPNYTEARNARGVAIGELGRQK